MTNVGSAAHYQFVTSTCLERLCGWIKSPTDTGTSSRSDVYLIIIAISEVLSKGTDNRSLEG